MRINSIIIDDEPNNIENIQSILQRLYPEITVVATATDAEDGIAAIGKLQPDLVFLDIQMPGRNGFEVLKAFPQIGFEIIFITAYNQYAIDAIRISAFDYLVKPVAIDDLQKAVNRLLLSRASKTRERLHVLKDGLGEPRPQMVSGGGHGSVGGTPQVATR